MRRVHLRNLVLASCFVLSCPLAHGAGLKSVAGKVVEYNAEKNRVVLIDNDGKKQSFAINPKFKGPDGLPEGTEVTIFVDSESSTVTKVLPKTPLKEVGKSPKSNRQSTKPQSAKSQSARNVSSEYRTSFQSFNTLESRRLNGEKVYKVEKMPSGAEIRGKLEGELNEVRRKAGLSDSSTPLPLGPRGRPIGPSPREIYQGGSIDFDTLERIRPMEVRRPTEFGRQYLKAIAELEQKRVQSLGRGGIVRRSDILSILHLPPGTDDSDTYFSSSNADVSVSGTGSEESIGTLVISMNASKISKQPDLLNDIETYLLVDTYSRCFISDWLSKGLSQSSGYGLPPATTIISDRGTFPTEKWDLSVEKRAYDLFYGGCRPLEDPIPVPVNEKSITFIELNSGQSLLWRVSADDQGSPERVLFIWVASASKSKTAEQPPVQWARVNDSSSFICGLSVAKDEQEKLSRYGLRKIKFMAKSDPIEAMGMYLLDIAGSGTIELFDKDGLSLEDVSSRLDGCNAQSVAELFDPRK